MGRKNIGASVRALLLNIARKQERDYNALLVQFAQERFLYRLSISSFSSHFVLKGALLLRRAEIAGIRHPSLIPGRDVRVPCRRGC